jgi:hypothetical protein
MLELSADAVREFQELYERETGRRISADQARAYATSITRLVEILLRLGEEE